MYYIKRMSSKFACISQANAWEKQVNIEGVFSENTTRFDVAYTYACMLLKTNDFKC